MKIKTSVCFFYPSPHPNFLFLSHQKGGVMAPKEVYTMEPRPPPNNPSRYPPIRCSLLPRTVTQQASPTTPLSHPSSPSPQSIPAIRQPNAPREASSRRSSSSLSSLIPPVEINHERSGRRRIRRSSSLQHCQQQ